MVNGFEIDHAMCQRYGKKKRKKKQYGRAPNLSDRRKGTRAFKMPSLDSLCKDIVEIHSIRYPYAMKE